ncbi:biotin--protein ligase 1, chloroplastic isoform X4 [Daucus carota subsp. sativus]|uniref:biotin--protein ligase 1, chloroplastic isoform X4 n=2 Tax=Daucus carota subsp. sativus TaxID=79200 RepID=UPI0030827038
MRISPRFFSLKSSPHFLSLPLLYHNTTKPFSLSSSAMESESTCILVLAGKSAADKELANYMKASNIPKLPDIRDVSLLLHEESLNEESFRINSYMNSLSTTCFGRFLIWSPRLPSTHDVVSKNFEELPVGSVCVADVQYKGRGRSMNVWESPKGCLMFSFTIQMEDGRIVPLVQYVVSLAMTEAINDVCTKDGVPYLDVRIKWPNDLYLDGLKVGGILCTSTYRSKKFNVSAGFKPLEELYYKTWLHSGQRVIVEEKNDDKDHGRQSMVTIQGLTSSGYLLAIGDDNQMCELHPDGNSFDFFKGLIRRKLA